VNGTNHTAYFVKAYFDANRIEYISNESGSDNNNSVSTGVLIVLIFVAFFLGLILMFALLKWKLERNGYRLKEMLRARKTLENEENDGGTATTNGELSNVVSGNNNTANNDLTTTDAPTMEVVQSDLKPGEEDIPL
jgi:hypothetical protein